eukprot:scaffold30090_cov112-Isochrysis_galbana.AAC.2
MAGCSPHQLITTTLHTWAAGCPHWVHSPIQFRSHRADRRARPYLPSRAPLRSDAVPAQAPLPHQRSAEPSGCRHRHPQILARQATRQDPMMWPRCNCADPASFEMSPASAARGGIGMYQRLWRVGLSGKMNQHCHRLRAAPDRRTSPVERRGHG